MQSLIGTLASSFGIPPQMASAAVGGVTQLFLKKSTPKAGSQLLSALPKEVTDQISDKDKQEIKTQQINNINRYDLLKQLSRATGIKDIDKLDDFADSVLDSIKKNAKINISDGLDEGELSQVMKDLSKDHLSKA
jgi:hypothetical protein